MASDFDAFIANAEREGREARAVFEREVIAQIVRYYTPIVAWGWDPEAGVKRRAQMTSAENYLEKHGWYKWLKEEARG